MSDHYDNFGRECETCGCFLSAKSMVTVGVWTENKPHDVGYTPLFYCKVHAPTHRKINKDWKGVIYIRIAVIQLSSMADPEISGGIRNDKGQFVPGVSGNPAGKPVGTVSIVAKIKQKFAENPEYFDEWVGKLMEDAGNRRAIMEQLDGKPHQTTDVTSEGKAIQPLLVRFLDANSNGDTEGV